MYAKIMKYFVIFGLFIFLGMTVYIDFLKVLIDKEYHSGLKVVPIILIANLIYGMYFTQSLWYKITDRTRYGAWQSIAEMAVAVSLNFLLIPFYGYMGSAVALLTSYMVVLTISYFLGQKYYPVPYNFKRIGLYFAVALALYFLSTLFVSMHQLVKYAVGTVLIALFAVLVFVFEKNDLKGLFKTNKKK
jgi:O-antigen/teichoic acid export membrane protein